MFSTLSKTEIIILATFYLSSVNALNLVKSKKLSFGKELSDGSRFSLELLILVVTVVTVARRVNTGWVNGMQCQILPISQQQLTLPMFSLGFSGTSVGL